MPGCTVIHRGGKFAYRSASGKLSKPTSKKAAITRLKQVAYFSEHKKS